MWCICSAFSDIYVLFSAMKIMEEGVCLSFYSLAHSVQRRPLKIRGDDYVSLCVFDNEMV
jgi:hypothetical protein